MTPDPAGAATDRKDQRRHPVAACPKPLKARQNTAHTAPNQPATGPGPTPKSQAPRFSGSTSYWYLSAAPELLAHAAHLLDATQAVTR
jgi:hypothetical protein